GGASRRRVAAPKARRAAGAARYTGGRRRGDTLDPARGPALRRGGLLGALGLVLALASGLALGLGVRRTVFRPRLFTIKSYDRVVQGMSRADAEAALGPPGDYTTGPTKSDSFPGAMQL